jgi:hypothetical protein
MVTRKDIEAEAAFVMGLIQQAREQDMVIELHTPKNEMPHIDQMWAFLSIDPEDGNEGVIAGPLMGPGSVVPLVAADEKRLASLEPVARQWATVFGRVVRLVKFSQREVIMEFGGQ